MQNKLKEFQIHKLISFFNILLIDFQNQKKCIKFFFVSTYMVLSISDLIEQLFCSFHIQSNF